MSFRIDGADGVHDAENCVLSLAAVCVRKTTSRACHVRRGVIHALTINIR